MGPSTSGPAAGPLRLSPQKGAKEKPSLLPPKVLLQFTGETAKGEAVAEVQPSVAETTTFPPVVEKLMLIRLEVRLFDSPETPAPLGPLQIYKEAVPVASVTP